MKNIIFRLIALMALSSCEKEKKQCPGSIEKTFSLARFKKINAGETFNVMVHKGTTFSIKAKGCAADIADLDINLAAGEFVNIAYKTYRKDHYRIDFEITLPELRSINLSGAATATVNGFDDQNTYLRIILSGTSKCSVSGTPGYVQIDITGKAQLDISGNTDEMNAFITGDGRLNAYGLTSLDAGIAVEGTAKAYVFVVNNFTASASGTGYIYYKGDPPVKDVETGGDGKVIRQ